MPTIKMLEDAWDEYHEIVRNLSIETRKRVEQEEVDDDVVTSPKLSAAHDAWKRVKYLKDQIGVVTPQRPA
jgi:hypothetical protein